MDHVYITDCLPLSCRLRRKGGVFEDGKCNPYINGLRGFAAYENYAPETIAYIEALGQINIWLAEQADTVYEVMAGQAVCWKAEDRK